MKRISIIVLILIYSMSTFGVNLKEFYCCGKLQSVSITFNNGVKDKCSMGDNTDGCCKTKVQSIKIKDSHFAAAHLATPSKYYTALHGFIPSWQPVAFVTYHIGVINGSHAPPMYRGVPVYISNCVFRI